MELYRLFFKFEMPRSGGRYAIELLLLNLVVTTLAFVASFLLVATYRLNMPLQETILIMMQKL